MDLIYFTNSFPYNDQYTEIPFLQNEIPFLSNEFDIHIVPARDEGEKHKVDNEIIILNTLAQDLRKARSKKLFIKFIKSFRYTSFIKELFKCRKLRHITNLVTDTNDIITFFTWADYNQNLFNQKKIINVLFIAAVGILILNLILDKFFLPAPDEENIEITSAEIDSTFRSGLFNLGIHEEWIKKQNKNSDNLSVLVPKDLPFVLILQEMNNVFNTNEVKIKSVEKKIGGRTTLNFISGEEEKLKADLIYNEKVRRKTVRVGFIVKRIDGPDETDSLLTGYPEQFAFLLIPSNNSANFVKKVITSGKEYILYLNDEIGELKYRLKENYSAIRLKNSVREIVGTFPGAVFFMIDDKSRVYNSGVYPLLKGELEKRKIKYDQTTDLGVCIFSCVHFTLYSWENNKKRRSSP